MTLKKRVALAVVRLLGRLGLLRRRSGWGETR